MGKYTGKMIISDLDGTLIPRGGVISAENRQAIADFAAEGVAHQCAIRVL